MKLEKTTLKLVFRRVQHPSTNTEMIGIFDIHDMQRNYQLSFSFYIQQENGQGWASLLHIPSHIQIAGTFYLEETDIICTEILSHDKPPCTSVYELFCLMIEKYLSTKESADHKHNASKVHTSSIEAFARARTLP